MKGDRKIFKNCFKFAFRSVSRKIREMFLGSEKYFKHFKNHPSKKMPTHFLKFHTDKKTDRPLILNSIQIKKLTDPFKFHTDKKHRLILHNQLHPDLLSKPNTRMTEMYTTEH